jgi:hypothetical protein
MANRRQILASIAAASSSTLLYMLRPARAQTVQKLTRIIIGTPPGGYPDSRSFANQSYEELCPNNHFGEQARRGPTHRAGSIEK